MHKVGNACMHGKPAAGNQGIVATPNRWRFCFTLFTYSYSSTANNGGNLIIACRSSVLNPYVGRSAARLLLEGAEGGRPNRAV